MQRAGADPPRAVIPTHRFAARLEAWTSESHGTWHFIAVPESIAGDLAGTALMRRLESGRRSGFGAVKLNIRLGGSQWQTSAFPIGQTGWAIPVSAKVRKAEGIAADDEVEVAIEV